MRTIKKIHKAESSPIGDLVTFRVLPTRTIGYVDPFLFLNHHGPQVYPPGNNGLPFGPHPHRGIETVTFILEGDIVHKDNSGHESLITSGGVQWMTAGSGLIHSEVSSPAFKKNGGPLEILQLWINLPAKDKMIKPFYQGLQKENIPHVLTDDGKVTVDVITGDHAGMNGAFKSLLNANLDLIHFKKDGKINLNIPASHNIFFYVIRGSLNVNGQKADSLNLVEFNNDGEEINITAGDSSVLLVGSAKPLNEPVVSAGPFVMNSEEEIDQAYRDYQEGKFGTWPHA